MSVLDEILERKRGEVEAARGRVSPSAMAERAEAVRGAPRGFRRALERGPAPAIIAEIKRRSPSKGLIRPDMDPEACARAYHAGGAACLSVLTDEHYFGGALDYVGVARRAVPLPILRKDFVVDAYQIDEARVAGADAVLLIVAALTPAEIVDFAKRAAERGLDALVEVHDEAELAVALESGATLVGVNNRDLRTFETDLAVTERLAERLCADRRAADVLLVAESGIHEHEDVKRLAGVGARAFLVGESLMRQDDVAAAVRQLRGAGPGEETTP